MNNAENIPGATVTVVGWVSADAAPPKFDSDGSRGLLEIRVPVNEGYKKDGEFVKTGTTWYGYIAGGDYAQDVLSGIKKGDKVRIEDARQEVREYGDDSNKRMGITLRFGTVTVLEFAGQEGPF